MLFRLELKNSRAEAHRYQKKIIDYLKLLIFSTDKSIAANSKVALATMYREVNELENAKKVLESIKEETYNKIMQSALILEKEKNFNEAYKIYEELIFKNVQEIRGALAMMIELTKKENLDDINIYISYYEAVNDVFELGIVERMCLCIDTAYKIGNDTKVKKILQEVLEKDHRIFEFKESFLYRHMDFSKYIELDEGESKEIIKKMIKNTKFYKEGKVGEELQRFL